MRRLAALAAIAAVLLVACSTAGPELESAVAARSAEVERLQRIAGSLHELRGRLAKAAEEERRMRVWRADGDAGAALKAVGEASEAPVGFQKLDGGRARFTLGGRGGGAGMGRALERLAGVAPGLAFVSASSDASGSWTIVVESRDAWKPAASADAAIAASPTPPPGRMESARLRALRVEIERLDAEIAKLRRVAGEAARFDEQLAIIEHERGRAKARDSVGGAAPWVSGVFGAVLAHGSVTSEGGSLVARGTLAGGVDAESLGTLARGRFEIVSVAPPSAEIRRSDSGG